MNVTAHCLASGGVGGSCIMLDNNMRKQNRGIGKSRGGLPTLGLAYCFCSALPWKNHFTEKLIVDDVPIFSVLHLEKGGFLVFVRLLFVIRT